MTSAYSADVKKDELQHVTGQIQQIQQSISQDREKQADLQEQLKTMEISLSTLAQEAARLTALQTAEQQKLSALKTQQERQQANLNQQHEVLAQQIRASYQMGKLYGVKLLLNQESSNTLSRHLSYYRYLAINRLDLINKIKTELASLNQTLEAITEHQATLQTLLEQKKAQQKKLAAAQLNRQQLISHIKQEVQSKEIQFATLVENQKALQEALNQIANQAANINSNQLFSDLHGKLLWPVRGSIATNFGSTLDVGDRRSTGVIIKAPLGTPVHAIASGKVIFANWLRGFGLLVIINHGNGYMSLYARNQTLYAKMGEQVKAGAVISAIGNTGGQEISSLYFEIRENGIPVNPSLWCRYT